MKATGFILVLVISVICINTHKAQSYIPTLSGSKFFELVENRGMGYFVNHSYLISCDTIIYGQNYKKAQRLDSSLPLGLYREDTTNHKIYRWNEALQKDALIIDYDLEVGDTMIIRGRNLTVSRIDTINYFSKLRKAIYFNNPESFIEGIGYRFGGVHDFGGYIEIIAINDIDYDCINSKYTIEEIKIFPNPTTGIIEVTQLDIRSAQVTIFDLLGRKVKEIMYSPDIDLSALETGIYLMQIKGIDKVFKVLKM